MTFLQELQMVTTREFQSGFLTALMIIGVIKAYVLIKKGINQYDKN